MAGHTFPTVGGLQLDFNGTKVGVFMGDTVLGPILVAAKHDPVQGWLAFYNKGPVPAAEWSGEVTKMGGITKLVESLLAAINAKFKEVFGGTTTAPTPVASIGDSVFTVANFNAILASNFVLSVVNGVPTLLKK